MFCIGFFTIEIFLSSISKPNYFNSFFFYLDVLATMSLLLDIHEARERERRQAVLAETQRVPLDNEMTAQAPG